MSESMQGKTKMEMLVMKVMGLCFYCYFIGVLLSHKWGFSLCILKSLPVILNIEFFIDKRLYFT